MQRVCVAVVLERAPAAQLPVEISRREADQRHLDRARQQRAVEDHHVLAEVLPQRPCEVQGHPRGRMASADELGRQQDDAIGQGLASAIRDRHRLRQVVDQRVVVASEPALPDIEVQRRLEGLGVAEQAGLHIPQDLIALHERQRPLGGDLQDLQQIGGLVGQLEQHRQAHQLLPPVLPARLLDQLHRLAHRLGWRVLQCRHDRLQMPDGPLHEMGGLKQRLLQRELESRHVIWRSGRGCLAWELTGGHDRHGEHLLLR